MNRYTLLEGMTAKGQGLILKGDQVETVTDADGRQGWRLTEAGAKLGDRTAAMGDGDVQRPCACIVCWEAWSMRTWRAGSSTGCRCGYGSGPVLRCWLFVAVPRDRARRMIWKHGRRLRGPELVTTAELNEKLGQSKADDDVRCRTG